MSILKVRLLHLHQSSLCVIVRTAKDRLRIWLLGVIFFSYGCCCINILNSPGKLEEETLVLIIPGGPTDRPEARCWPWSHCVTLEMLLCCLGRGFCFPLFSLKVVLFKACSRFPFGTQIELCATCLGILFLVSNTGPHLRFLFHLQKYDCDNFISAACMAPLASRRQSG